MGKNPKVQFTPSDKKVPRIETDPTSFLKLNPSWRFAKMQFCDPYGWHTVDARVLSAIRLKLADFELMTWSEILVAGKRRNHTIRIDSLASQARKALHEIGVDEAVSLRLSGKQRVWGIFSKGVLQLLWWDPDHKVCPSILD